MRQSRVVKESFKVEHIGMMDCYETPELDFTPDQHRVKEILQPNVTFFFEGQPMAAGGLVIRWKTAEIWFFLSKKAGKTVILEVKDQLYEWMRDYGLSRVQAVMRWDNLGARRFAQWVGMKNETPDGILHFGPDDQTYCMYAVVR